MLIDLYNTRKALKSQDVNFQTPSPYDHSQRDYVYTSIGEPFCRNLPYTTWYVQKFKHLEKGDFLGSAWEAYLQDQIYYLRYNNPGISKLAVGVIISVLKYWGLNRIIFEDLELAEYVSMYYDAYPSNWYPDTIARHWYSVNIEKAPREPNESFSDWSKRKVIMKAKLRAEDNDNSNKEIVKTASLDYQAEKGGLIPTAELLVPRTQKSSYIIKKVGNENEDWQRKGTFTEQCIELALMINPHFTQQELADIVSKELPAGTMSIRGVQQALRRMKELNL